jgi:tetratricopeptide (TPR) repeat protein
MEMEDRLRHYQERRRRRQEYKELAAKNCCSVIVVVIALVALRPLMVDQILGRAEAYSAVGRLDESQRECDKALLIDDNSSHAWCQSARISKTRGNREAAYEAYHRAVRADAGDRSANFELGMMYADDGRYQSAIPHFEQVRALGSDKVMQGRPGSTSCHKAALHMLALCYQKVGDPVKTELIEKEIHVFYPVSGTIDKHSLPPDDSRP